MSWKQHFQVGDVREVAGVVFRVAHIGKRGLVLHPLKPPVSVDLPPNSRPEPVKVPSAR